MAAASAGGGGAGQLAFKQDMPPAGGYRKIKWSPNIPSRGPPAWSYFAAAGLYMIPALYIAYRQHRQIQYFMIEQADARNAMMPFVMAERDRALLRRYREDLEFEADLMKDVPGWRPNTWFGSPIYTTVDTDLWRDLHISDSYSFCKDRIWFRHYFDTHYH